MIIFISMIGNVGEFTWNTWNKGIEIVEDKEVARVDLFGTLIHVKGYLEQKKV
jgi:hypothetical protein